MTKKVTIEVTDNEVVKRSGDKVIIEIPVERVKDFFGNKVKLASVPVGKTFMLGNEEWIVLEQHGNETAVLKKELLSDIRKFDEETNNFAGSDISYFLNTTYKEKLLKLVGNNLCKHLVDLTSDDGLKDYKNCSAFVSLLTCEQYRKYADIMLKYSCENWWYLATADSTPTRTSDKIVRCVGTDGVLRDVSCRNAIHVRPFCILKSCCEVLQ